jgi:hypothetical protein
MRSNERWWCGRNKAELATTFDRSQNRCSRPCSHLLRRQGASSSSPREAQAPVPRYPAPARPAPGEGRRSFVHEDGEHWAKQPPGERSLPFHMVWLVGHADVAKGPGSRGQDLCCTGLGMAAYGRMEHGCRTSAMDLTVLRSPRNKGAPATSAF